MPRILKEGPESFCIQDCPKMRLTLETDRELIGSTLIVSHIVSCVNYPICKMWNDIISKQNNIGSKPCSRQDIIDGGNRI